MSGYWLQFREPAASPFGSYLVRTTWDVPVDAKLSSTYSALVSAMLVNSSIDTTVWDVSNEGGSFAVRFPFMRNYSDWSYCSSSCGIGVRTRNTTCVNLATGAQVSSVFCAGLGE